MEVREENGLSMGRVEFGAIRKTVCLEYIADAQPGEWVLVHVGFALSRIDEDEAARIFEMLESITEEIAE